MITPTENKNKDKIKGAITLPPDGDCWNYIQVGEALLALNLWFGVEVESF